MSVQILKQGLIKADGYSNPNLFNWNDSGNNIITLDTYQNTGSFTQFFNCLVIDPSTTVGTKYTISFWARSPNGTTSINLYNSNSNPRYFYFNAGTLTSNLGSEWQQFTYTFTNQDRGSGLEGQYSKRIEIYMANQIGGQIKNVKIEEGEKATFWIPASTENIYVGSICGFSELGGDTVRIGTNCIESNEFIEF